MNTKQSRRSALQLSKPSKPSHKRGHSLNYLPSSTHRSATSPRRSTGFDTAHQGEDLPDDDMAGLPQFCTTCEKQIVTPGNSILYCSAACRKQDAARTVSIHSVLTPPTSIPTAASYFDVPETRIVTPRSPTVLRPASLIFSEHPTSELLPPDGDYEYSADEDDAAASSPSASRFYSQSYPDERQRNASSKSNRNSAAAEGIPSLSNSPSSSVGTVASIDRTLMHRYNRSSGVFQPKSIDLVMPSFADLEDSKRAQGARAGSLASSASTRTVVRVADAEGTL